VSASLEGFVRRHRAILGKRTATPERWRLDAAMPSKARERAHGTVTNALSAATW
jgi:hypothetical protein